MMDPAKKVRIQIRNRGATNSETYFLLTLGLEEEHAWCAVQADAAPGTRAGEPLRPGTRDSEADLEQAPLDSHLPEGASRPSAAAVQMFQEQQVGPAGITKIYYSRPGSVPVPTYHS